MEDLIKKIEQWANDRNIIKGSKPIDQAMKLFSEFGELADNVGKGRDIKDDCGDIFVVLTIMSVQLGLNIKSLEMNTQKEKPNYNAKHCVVDLGRSLNYFSRSENMINLKESVNDLHIICALHGLTLQECVQIAYNDIKDRKGVMSNGFFIKESDPSYLEVIKSI